MLERPPHQQRVEHKYRCAQAIVFGLPVVALQCFGEALGGPPAENARWVALLQALLAGWIIYVAATGLIVEAFILRRFTPDAAVGFVGLLIYLLSLLSIVGIFLSVNPIPPAPLFHWIVVLLAGWCGLRWWQLRHFRQVE